MTTETPRRPHPKAIGDSSEAMVLARLVQAGKVVLVPFGENQRYDLVIDEGDHFIRVQCKTGRLKNGSIRFPTCSTTYHHPANQGMVFYQHPYIGQIDVFGVYCPETDSAYLVPIEELGTRMGYLRVVATRNNQAKRVRWAAEYEIRPG